MKIRYELRYIPKYGKGKNKPPAIKRSEPGSPVRSRVDLSGKYAILLGLCYVHSPYDG